MKLATKYCERAAATALFVVCTACSDSSSVPDVHFLASDMNFLVAGQRLVIPAVAIIGTDSAFDLNDKPKQGSGLTQALRVDASDPTRPMKMDDLDLSIRQYQYTGERLESMDICGSLTRQWSQTVCRGEHHGLLARLPSKFSLIDAARLDILRTHWTVGKERVYDQVRQLPNKPGVTEIGCDAESRFCTAAVEALPGLLAVWPVWTDEKPGSSAMAMAETQGTAIVEFVRRALGPIDDVTLVDED